MTGPWVIGYLFAPCDSESPPQEFLLTSSAIDLGCASVIRNCWGGDPESQRANR